MDANKIDPIHWVERDLPTQHGTVRIGGMTVRALKIALQDADPDDMVTYMAEVGEQVTFGIIGGVALGDGVCIFIGPEVGHAMATNNATIPPVANEPPPPVDRNSTATTNGAPLEQRPETDGDDGQHSNYLILNNEERKKGFVRPVRDSYRHIECGAVTVMANSIAETYARDPQFYSATFCMQCKAHFPVGEDGEFDWIEMDGSPGPKVGT